GGEVVQDNTMAPLSKIALHAPTVMTAGVVTDDMDFAVTQQATAQILKMAHEQGRTAALFGPTLGDYQSPCTPVERTGQVALLIRPGRGDLNLVPPAHPHRPDFGIRIDIHFILEDPNLIGGQGGQELAQDLQLALPLRIAWADHRPGPPPDQLLPMQPAPHGFLTDAEFIALQQQHDNHPTTPPTAQEPEIPGAQLCYPLRHHLSPPPAQPSGR